MPITNTKLLKYGITYNTNSKLLKTLWIFILDYLKTYSFIHSLAQKNILYYYFVTKHCAKLLHKIKVYILFMWGNTKQDRAGFILMPVYTCFFHVKVINGGFEYQHFAQEI